MRGRNKDNVCLYYCGLHSSNRVSLGKQNLGTEVLPDGIQWADEHDLERQGESEYSADL